MLTTKKVNIMAIVKKKIATPKKKVVKKYGDGGRNQLSTPPPQSNPESTAPTYKPWTDYGYNNQPTADSTLYFTQKQRYFQDAEAANRARGNRKEAKNADLAREKASKDRKRQRRKGMAGYDGNGYPNKATAADIMRNGGKVTTKKVNKMAIAKKKIAPAKKKAVPAKGAWTPPWAKKVITEKKTGEKYASKAAKAKHEKSEPKKVRIAEGEIKKKKSGSKVAKMKTIGKKYEYGGTTGMSKKPTGMTMSMMKMGGKEC